MLVDTAVNEPVRDVRQRAALVRRDKIEDRLYPAHKELLTEASVQGRTVPQKGIIVRLEYKTI